MATGTTHFDALAGLQAVVVALSLDGIPNADPLPPERVYLRELFDDRNVILPCVVVAKAPMPETRLIEDNETNRIGYPCMIVVIVPQNQNLVLTEGPSRWRQQIEEVFDFKKPQGLIDALDDVTLFQTEWQPLDVIDLAAFHDKNLLVSGAIVMVNVWKQR